MKKLFALLSVSVLVAIFGYIAFTSLNLSSEFSISYDEGLPSKAVWLQSKIPINWFLIQSMDIPDNPRYSVINVGINGKGGITCALIPRDPRYTDAFFLQGRFTKEQCLESAYIRYFIEDGFIVYQQLMEHPGLLTVPE